ncbi:MAG TPA: outer membrane beta-barrel protein [Flavobacteriales bacterium]|nr:outer membrane beta-barrel protein [Flavobacteriales bacterium]
MNTMKIIALPALLAAAALSAQELRLGGGLNMSNVREAGHEQWTGRAGYQAGADLQLGSLWFVRGGAHLQVRNLGFSTVTLDSADAAGTLNQEYRYTDRTLRVPLLVGRNLLDASDEPVVNAYVMAGPTALFPISARLTNDEFDVRTRSAQWLIGFGGGVTLGPLFVEATYGIAMTDVFEGATFRTNPMVNQFCLNAGARLRLVR